jgi:hypothetical protein
MNEPMLLDLVSVANRKRGGFNSSSRKYSGGSFLIAEPLLLLDMLNFLSCSSCSPGGGNGSAVAEHPVFIPGGGIDSDEADGSGFPAGWPVGILLLDTLGAGGLGIFLHIQRNLCFINIPIY